MTGAYWKGHERRNSVPLGANLRRRKTDRTDDTSSNYVSSPIDYVGNIFTAGVFDADNYSSPSSDPSPAPDSGSSDMSGGGGSFDGGGASGDF